MFGQSTPYCAVLSSPWPSEPPIPLVSKPDSLHTPICIAGEIKTPPTPKIVDFCSESFSATPTLASALVETPGVISKTDPLSETPTTQLSPLRFESPESTQQCESTKEESVYESAQSTNKPDILESTKKKSAEGTKTTLTSKSPKTQYVIPQGNLKEKPIRVMTSTTSPRPITIASFGADTEKWKVKPVRPIRGTTTFILRKQFHTYCGKRKYKSPPRKRVDYKESPKPAVRQTKGTKLRKIRNKVRVSEILKNEDKRRPFR